MKKTKVFFTVVAVAVVAVGSLAQDSRDMSFFVTSVGGDDGANFGGLSGADAHCQALAESVGAGDRAWRAYLSTSASDGQQAVHARDRIGEGPWHNVGGELVAENAGALHSDNANITPETALTEKGGSPSRHDILTGSQVDGTAFPSGDDRTCGNWTSGGEGSAWVGHADRLARGVPGSPWNAAHASRGCSHEQLQSTGGDGLLYCFAAD